MIPYLIGWALAATATLVVLFAQRGYREAVGLCLVYFGLLAFFRGEVGTDTHSYEMLFERILAGNAIWSAEGAYGVVGLILCEGTGSVTLGVRALSLLFFALLATACVRADRDELLLLAAFILPVFGYQYSMNVLRVGMAMAVLFLAVQSLRRVVSTAHLCILFLPMLFHYSSIVASAYVSITTLRTSIKVIAVTFIVVASVVAAFYFNLQDYALGKVQVYEAFAAPSEASGLSRIVVVAILCIGVLLGNLPAGAKARVTGVTVILAAAFLAVTKDTAAGLRLLDLLSFSMPLSALLAYSMASQAADMRFKLSLCVAGPIGALGVGRNFLDEAGHGNSPFVPYDTWISIF